MHAMCANLDVRYASATEMLYDLEEFRKDPTILFQSSGIPAAPAAAIRPNANRIQEKTPAERRSEERARLRKLEEQRRAARRKRIRSIAFIAGSIALLALIIILVASACSKKDVKYITVPDFTDKVFADLSASDYPGLQLVENSKEYSDEFESGHIITQSPKPNTEVEEGTKVLLTVSLGRVSTKMPDLRGMKSNDAEKLLSDS